MKTNFATLVLVLSSTLGFGQAVNGDATQLSCNCYRLTEASNNQSGSVWNSEQISLEDSFDYSFDVYLGDIPQGADGIAFVLQPISTSVGSLGGGMGYEGISPSIAMSIDTYNNGANDGDIFDDHVAIMSNGSVEHFTADNLAGPEIALVSGANIEDGNWHIMRVTWDPVTTTINFYMDGSLRTSYTGDIINDIFSGDPNVFWGFTGSTGGLNNQQEFCFSLIPGLASNQGELCAGDSIEFFDNSSSTIGEVVAWDWNFDNGFTDTLETPGFVPFETAGTYWVRQTVTDTEGCDASDSLEITVHPNPETEFVANEVCEGEEMDLSDDSFIAEGSITQWDWTFEEGGQASGENVSNTFPEAGTYNVTLKTTSLQGCVDSTSADVIVFENPTAEGQIITESLDGEFMTNLNVGDDAQWVVLDTAYSTDGLFNYTFPDSGWYDISLIVVDENGCSDTADYQIYVEGFPEFEMPNVFSPNGDGMNELFEPSTVFVEDAVLRIFNRWGRPVFNYEGTIGGSSSGWGWDGTINGGTKAAAGTYFYVLDLKGVNGDTFAQQGTVTLVR